MRDCVSGTSPARTSGRAGDLAAPPWAEPCGAGGTPFQSSQSSQGGGVGIHGARSGPAFQDRDALGRGMTTGARRADLVRVFRFPRLADVVTDEAPALGSDIEYVVESRHA